MTPSIRYIASIDTSSSNPDGSIADDDLLILDAIPSSVLERYQRDEMLSETRESIDFLLLRLNVKNISNIDELEGRNLVCFNLSNTKPISNNLSFPANSIDFSFDGESNSDGEEFWVEFLKEQPSSSELATLNSLAKFSYHLDATKGDCYKYLSHVRTHNCSVGVYDVGQANFCSIVDENEHPLVFFDLGWPVRFNSKSNSKMRSFNPFALDDIQKPTPVILSHLDWDHWAYAYKSGRAVWDHANGYWKSEIQFRKEAIKRPWLVRRPDYMKHKLGPSHINFIQTLSNQMLMDGSSALKIWPKKSDRLYFKSIIIFQCKPGDGLVTNPAFLRNNESLGLLVTDKKNMAKVLLCGDADYPSIPKSFLKNLTGIVAPHHGGKVTKGSTPQAVGHGRMVFSTYPNCYNNVPSKDTENEAKSLGWDVFKTSDRAPCLNNAACTTGNKLIRLSTSPRCGCNIVDQNCLCILQ